MGGNGVGIASTRLGLLYVKPDYSTEMGDHSRHTNERVVWMSENFLFMAIELSTHGVVNLTLYSLHHQLTVLKGNFVNLISTDFNYCGMILLLYAFFF